MKPKRRLTKFNFEAEGSHIALVHASQGGPANGYNYALVLKATNDITDEQVEESLSQVDKDMSSSEGVTNQPEGNSLSDNNTKEDNMSEEMVAKSVMELEIAKAVEDAVTKAVEAKHVELVAKQAELDAALEVVKGLEAKEKESVEKGRKAVLKEAGVAEDQVEVLYKSTEALSAEAFEVVAKAMAKDKKAVEESDLFKEAGVSGETNSVEEDGVAALTKSMQKQFQKEAK
jgi:gamma-glutamylcysteine synthetase